MQKKKKKLNQKPSTQKNFFNIFKSITLPHIFPLTS